ncbi:MAG: hypothetical protein MUE66_07045 [Acidimicrobiia bacterium]|nr:hypothetical protein [Acidimicrobiia bacterium]
MLRVILEGLVLRRRAYLRMVLAREGVADSALVVGAVYLMLAVPGILGSAGLWRAGTSWRATAPSPA